VKLGGYTVRSIASDLRHCSYHTVNGRQKSPRVQEFQEQLALSTRCLLMETMEVSQSIGIPGTVGTKYTVLTDGNHGSLPE